MKITAGGGCATLRGEQVRLEEERKAWGAIEICAPFIMMDYKTCCQKW
jgi:hypothetical protein